MRPFTSSPANVIISNSRVRTIEGDLFTAFVAAGAISKANGDDPKKSSLVRCARTDKGVHAASNLISLKLIIGDPDIVQKINEKLCPQIRVFSIQRTIGSFSAYQLCDSRIYEYLIPTHVFLPPHPTSFLGRKLVELAEESNDVEGYQNRQSEVSTFWEENEEQYIKPILEQLDPSIRSQVLEALYKLDASLPGMGIGLNTPDEAKHEDNTFSNSGTISDTALNEAAKKDLIQQATNAKVEDADQYDISKMTEGSDRVTKLNTMIVAQDKAGLREDTSLPFKIDSGVGLTELTTEGPIQQSSTSKTEYSNQQYVSQKTEASDQKSTSTSTKSQDPVPQSIDLKLENAPQRMGGTLDSTKDPQPISGEDPALELAIKSLKAAYIAAKNAYRIHPRRLARVRTVLSRFVGSQNYHNYTIQKPFNDSSAKRHIKSFDVHDEPVLINGTEWLSLKVHGQSFMMHQIRKMVSMAALVVRCGCHEGRLQDSFQAQRMSIPKAPGLGLLLERPVFEVYNQNLTKQEPRDERESIDVSRFDREIEEFKQREIYERIFREEERDHSFVSPLLSLSSSFPSSISSPAPLKLTPLPLSTFPPQTLMLSRLVKVPQLLRRDG